MAYGSRAHRSGKPARAGVLAAVIGLHVVGAWGLSQTTLRRPAEPESVPVEVVFLQDAARPQSPPPPPVALASLAVELPVPVVQVPLVEAPPAPAAITVARTIAPRPESAAAPAAPMVVDAVDYLRPPAPRYPQAAKRARVQGTVVLRVLIDTEGRPCEVVVHESSGSEQLDAAARESVMAALFKPHLENGVARTVQVLIPIEFSLTVRTARR